MSFTGTEINYLHVCPRKLWLFRHGLRPEAENDFVQLGRLLNDTAFSRATKEIPIGEVGVLDWANLKDGTIHETKHGKTPENGDIAQVQYYMYFMREQGIPVKRAVIHYPRQRKTQEICWDDELKNLVLNDISKANDIVSGKIPSVQIRPYCGKCAYEELCFA